MGKLKTGIIGSPIKHSLSPIIHKYWMKKNKINGEYLTFDIKKEEISSFVEQALKNKFIGFNITIPHKENIIPFLSEITEEARAIGAVNTVVIKNNKFMGHNTDTYGFIENLNNKVPKWKQIKGSVAVIGAGGAARAVIWSLLSTKYSEIKIINRSKERAKALIGDIKKFFPNADITFSNDFEMATKNAVLLVNASSLGMKGQPPLNIKLNNLSKNAIVYDLVYSPLNTELLAQAKKYNFTTIGGLGMLLHQASPAFKMWFGKPAKIDIELKRMVSEHL